MRGCAEETGGHSVSSRLGRRFDRSENDGDNRNRSWSRSRVIYGNGDGNAGWRQLVAELFYGRSCCVSSIEAPVKQTLVARRDGSGERFQRRFRFDQLSPHGVVDEIKNRIELQLT